jgi:hypothetical protein
MIALRIASAARSVQRGLDSDSMIDRRLRNGSSAAKPICRICDVT